MKHTHDFVDSLCTILLKQGALKRDDAQALKKAFYDRSDIGFDEFLLQEGLVSRTQLLNALSEYYQVPAFDVTGYFFEHERLHEFPKDFLLRNLIIPLERDENILVVIAANPGDEDLLPEIGAHVSYDIQFMVGIAQDITDAVKEFYEKSLTAPEPDEPGRGIEETEEVEELLHPHHADDE